MAFRRKLVFFFCAGSPAGWLASWLAGWPALVGWLAKLAVRGARFSDANLLTVCLAGCLAGAVLEVFVWLFHFECVFT